MNITTLSLYIVIIIYYINVSVLFKLLFEMFINAYIFHVQQQNSRQYPLISV